MESLIIFVHVIAAIGITGLVLIQHGKGADMGASFGSGASQTIFGSVGSSNALTKSTSWLATVFFATSLVLALFARQQAGQAIEADGLIENTGVITETPAVVEQDVPALATDSAASDIPQAAAAVEQAAGETAPVVDEALQAAMEQAQALAAEAQAAAAEGNPEAVAAEVEEAAADLQNAPAEEPAQ